MADYSLAVDPGSYSKTGQAADVRHGYHLQAVRGQYVVTGFLANLKRLAATYPAILIPFPFIELPRDYQVHRFVSELDYEQTRLKVTNVPRKFRFLHKNVNPSELSTWIAFWDMYKGRAQSFNFPDPRTAEVIEVRFVQPEPIFVRTGARVYELEVELEEVL